MHTVLDSPVKSSQSLSTNEENSKLEVASTRVDGSLVTFTQDRPSRGGTHCRDCQTPDFFKQERIAVAGQHSVATLVLIESCAH